MSGWTCITVEPKQSNDEQFAPYKDRQELANLASTLVAPEEPAVGPDECGLSIEEQEKTLDEIEQRVSSLKAQTGELEAEQVVYDWLDEWSDGFFDSHSAMVDWHSPPTCQYPSRGTDLPESAKEILNDCPLANRVLIIHANDTSDSGAGYLYERDEEGTPHKVDEKVGYEGCVGRDVEGYFREEHRISGCASPF